jgi:hypothetical protein
MNISEKALQRSCGRLSGGTGKIVCEKGSESGHAGRRVLDDRAAWAGVINCLREKANGRTCKTFSGRRAAAGRQIDFASLRDAGGFGGRDQRAAEFFCGGGLPQHARVYERAGRGGERRERVSAGYGARAARIEEQLAGAGCGKFRDDHALARGDFGGAGIHYKTDGRRVVAEEADEESGRTAAGDGRGYSREG